MHLSQAEIQKMKKNMRKVPLIQEKSALYHEIEDKEAEAYITQQLSTHNEETPTHNKHVVHEQQNRFQKTLVRIHNKIQNLYTLKQK